MNGLIILGIGLTALVGSLCTLLYMRLQNLTTLTMQLQLQLGKMDVNVHELASMQSGIDRNVKDLAKDVLQREVYQCSDDRHQLAIQAAREGQSVAELVRKHGLSTDEAALIIALHAEPARVGDPQGYPQTLRNLVVTDSVEHS